MKKLGLIAVLAVSMLATFGGAAVARTLPPSPTISMASVEAREHTLTITGRNFGTTAPTVVLAGKVLQVKSFSPGQVVAILPQAIAAATYSLTVITTGRARIPSNEFSTTVFVPDER